ncbi:Mediator of RNA polymerase II transcription subunit [Sesamum angolense]|uniref:Mediator of RNA polymerase II transcription subunit n=1 Tax=Sesamum angolense TaxID=2727404 RepID=A0AAE1W903_9LAMI|nr:Mediator of RNA polymerase II transcription subunit [Sesamum angolense]
MEDKPATLSSSPASSNYTIKTVQELAIDGQKHLQETIQAAFLILSAMDGELFHPNIGSTTVAASSAPPNTAATTSNACGGSTSMSNGQHSNVDVLSDSSSASSSASASALQSHPQHHNSFDIGAGAVDEARLQYKSSVTALRSVLITISNAKKGYNPPYGSTVAEVHEAVPTSNSPADQMAIEKLEEQASALRKVSVLYLFMKFTGGWEVGLDLSDFIMEMKAQGDSGVKYLKTEASEEQVNFELILKQQHKSSVSPDYHLVDWTRL